MRKQFAVLGLGSFGWSVALTLEKMGCDVLVVDDSYEKIQEISEQVSFAVRADVTDPEALQTLGGRNLDGVVIAVSENFEASIMATLLCKDMGIPLVVAKAKDDLQGTILKKVGADSVVYPEIDMGSRVAKNLVAREFTDWIELSEDYSMVEAVVPEPWCGKCLADLKVRERFGINVVGIIINKQVDVAFDPQAPLPAEGILIMVGSNDILQKFDAKKGKR
ncbi:MAG TPA: TrkA family potassium uptake protein [Candidatus Mediterraneibacter pullistercoris]|nr:TrkA family potassium uptake protein [Candidatus Mediterraneibacter pullistercoris]